MEKYTDSVKNNFGERLYSALGGGTIQQIKERLKSAGMNVDYASLRRYINNERRPSFEILADLSRFGNTTIDWLITGDNKTAITEPHNLMTEAQFTVVEKLAEATEQPYGAVFRNIFDNAIYPYSHPLEITRYHIRNVWDSSAMELPVHGKVLNDFKLDHFDDVSPSRFETATVPEEIFLRKKIHRTRDLHENSFAYTVEADDQSDIGILKGSIVVCHPLARRIRTGKMQNIPMLIISENRKHFEFGYSCFHPFEKSTVLFRPATEPLRFIPIEDLTTGYSFNEVLGVVSEQ